MARRSGSSGEKTAIALHDAAVRLFARHGFAAVSMRQIAAEIGVQVGALYLYTADKQALLNDILSGHMEHLLLTAGETLPVSGSPAARLEAFVRFHIRYHVLRPEKVFISYMELRNLTEDNFAAIEVLRRRYEDLLEDILKAGKAGRDFHITDTRLTTLAMIAMLTGISTWYKSGGRMTQEEIEAHYLEMVNNMVGRPLAAELLASPS
ncbi:MAG: TetR/AcrR family transcriptional regulator [Pseudomonadota bacterium]